MSMRRDYGAERHEIDDLNYFYVPSVCLAVVWVLHNDGSGTAAYLKFSHECMHMFIPCRQLLTRTLLFRI